jgi:hypothetical protein
MHLSDIMAGLERGAIVFGLSFGLAALIFILGQWSRAALGKAVPNLLTLCVVAFVFGILALVTGLVTGASRSAAVGQVLPAALGLIGAVALFVVTKSPKDIPLAATAVAAFSVMLLVGTVLGSYERVRSVAYENAQRYDLKRLKTEADVEFFINGYRGSRGLAPLSFEGAAKD